MEHKKFIEKYFPTVIRHLEFSSTPNKYMRIFIEELEAFAGSICKKQLQNVLNDTIACSDAQKIGQCYRCFRCEQIMKTKKPKLEELLNE